MSKSLLAAESRAAHYARPAILFFVVFLNLLGFGIVIPLLPFFAAAVNADPLAITLLFSAYSLGQMLAEPAWGRISDKVGRRPVLVASAALTALGYLLFAATPSNLVMLIARFVQGLGAGNISVIQGYIADITPADQRAGRMGLIGAAFGAGFVIGPGLGGLMSAPELGRIGYLLPIFAAAAASAVAAAAVLFFLPESPRVPGGPAPARNWKLVGLVSPVLLVTAVQAIAFSSMEASFGLWAEALHSWTARQVGLVYVVVGVTVAAAQALLVGRAARILGEQKMLALGTATFGVCFLLLGLGAPGAWIFILFSVSAIGQAFVAPAAATLVSRSASPDQQGAMLGLNTAAGAGARIIGPLLAGMMISGIGIEAPFFATAGLALLATLIASILVRGRSTA